MSKFEEAGKKVDSKVENFKTKHPKICKALKLGGCLVVGATIGLLGDKVVDNLLPGGSDDDDAIDVDAEITDSDDGNVDE